MSDKKNESRGHHEHHHHEQGKNRGEAAPEKKTPEPAETVESLSQKLESQNDRYLRLMAEFDNFKKRSARDFERIVETANELLISELIEVRENMERAVKSAEECDNVKTLSEGIKLIFTRFHDILAKNGLEPFGEAGEPFDPQSHDALMKIPHETIPEDHIVEVFEKGYLLRKKVIKHAKVVVSGGKTDSGNVCEKADVEGNSAA